MPYVFRRIFSAAPILAVFFVAACSPPANTAQGGLVIVEPWTRATPAGASVGAGYMEIVNEGQSAVKLLGGETPVAEKVEVHTMSMENGVMAMRPVTGGLEIPAQGKVALSPGGNHLMLMGLKRPLAEGESVPLALVFDSGARIDVELNVRGMGGGDGH